MNCPFRGANERSERALAFIKNQNYIIQSTKIVHIRLQLKEADSHVYIAYDNGTYNYLNYADEELARYSFNHLSEILNKLDTLGAK